MIKITEPILPKCGDNSSAENIVTVKQEHAKAYIEKCKELFDKHKKEGSDFWSRSENQELFANLFYCIADFEESHVFNGKHEVFKFKFEDGESVNAVEIARQHLMRWIETNVDELPIEWVIIEPFYIKNDDYIENFFYSIPKEFFNKLNDDAFKKMCEKAELQPTPLRFYSPLYDNGKRYINDKDASAGERFLNAAWVAGEEDISNSMGLLKFCAEKSGSLGDYLTLEHILGYVKKEKNNPKLDKDGSSDLRESLIEAFGLTEETQTTWQEKMFKSRPTFKELESSELGNFLY